MSGRRCDQRRKVAGSVKLSPLHRRRISVSRDFHKISFSRFPSSRKTSAFPSLADLRKYLSFRSLVERMRKIDLAQSPHIRFVYIDRDEIPSWLSWNLSTLPISKLTTCEDMQLPWQCGEFCRGAEELRKGKVEGNWTPLEATRFRHARRFT